MAFAGADHRDRVAFLTTVALFALSCFVFSISPIVDTSDSMYSMLLSESILHHHSTHLNQYKFAASVAELKTSTPPTFNPQGSSTYELGKVNGNVVYCFPNGSSVLSLPFVALMNAIGVHAATPDGTYSRTGEIAIEKMLSGLLMALVTCIVFRSSLLVLNANASALIAFAFAFGTQVWSTATRALWSHTWFVFLGGLAVYLILRAESQHRSISPPLLATILSWMYFVRPTAAIPIGCITVYILVSRAREFKTFAIAGALWFGAFVTYSWFTFGEVVPGYYLASRLQPRSLSIALGGVLISPSRGLFVYAPIVSVALYLVARFWKELPHRGIAIVSLAVVLLHIVCIAGYPNWWGGGCYGPRLATDLLPWFAMLAIVGCAGAVKARGFLMTTAESAPALILLALSIAINARGAFSVPTQQWSTVVDVDKHPEHVFDWSYPQFAAGLVTPPEYVIDNIRRLKHIASTGAAAK